MSFYEKQYRDKVSFSAHTLYMITICDVHLDHLMEVVFLKSENILGTKLLGLFKLNE